MNFTTLLAILQQSEYDLEQVKVWSQKHAQESKIIQPEKWTAKLRLIRTISQALFFLSPLQRMKVALTLVQFPEQLIRQYYSTLAKWKLQRLRRHGLKVVAIAGSYGKTSTKNILDHTLSGSLKVLVTPKSVNTLLGIAKIILQDLKNEHQLFVVEFGEYHPQDIPNLTRFVQPDYGILTPIGRQHLSIIGGFENILKTFQYFVEYFTGSGQLLSAIQNQSHFPDQKLMTYGEESRCELAIEQIKISRAGTEFVVNFHDQKLSVFTPLFGAHQAINLLPALWIADKLGVSSKQVVTRFATQPYITRRHEPVFAENNVLILDNSYNTNPDSVQASLELLKTIDGSNKIFITLGFVELDDNAESIHRQFGQQLAKYVDYVGLIESPWSQTIVDGFVKNGGKKSQVMIGKDQEEVLTKLRDKIVPDSVIVFEGGFQEVHV